MPRQSNKSLADKSGLYKVLYDACPYVNREDRIDLNWLGDQIGVTPRSFSYWFEQDSIPADKAALLLAVPEMQLSAKKLKPFIRERAFTRKTPLVKPSKKS